jgi:hypothetical protein
VILSLLRSGQTDEDQIRAVLSNFAAAIDTEDQPGMLQMMCQEEATGITDSEDYDPAAPRASVDPRQLEPPNISDVRVFGDVASAKVTRRSTNSTLYLRKENGHWKLCAPAANQIPAAKPS